MRLKPDKINKLSELVFSKFKTIDKLRILVPEDEFKTMVKNVIMDDLKKEEEIEQEARDILEKNKIKIQMRHVNYSELLRKTKEILAREKKFTL